MAQPSFYVHFADIDDLLHNLIDELAADLSKLNREARRKSRNAPTDLDKLRATYRVPLLRMVAHPALLRLLVRMRLDPVSPLGEWSREVWATNRQEPIEDKPDRESARRRTGRGHTDGLPRSRSERGHIHRSSRLRGRGPAIPDGPGPRCGAACRQLTGCCAEPGVGSASRSPATRDHGCRSTTHRRRRLSGDDRHFL